MLHPGLSAEAVDADASSERPAKVAVSNAAPRSFIMSPSFKRRLWTSYRLPEMLLALNDAGQRHRNRPREMSSQLSGNDGSGCAASLVTGRRPTESETIPNRRSAFSGCGHVRRRFLIAVAALPGRMQTARGRFELNGR